MDVSAAVAFMKKKSHCNVCVVLATSVRACVCVVCMRACVRACVRVWCVYVCVCVCVILKLTTSQVGATAAIIAAAEDREIDGVIAENPLTRPEELLTFLYTNGVCACIFV